MTITYTWINSKKQAGTETDEGQWDMRPHPYLAVQLQGDTGKTSEHMYWHPDYVIFKGGASWYVSQRNPREILGPYKNKTHAKNASTMEDEQS